jgi:putative ABC transport system permease protein
MNALRLAWLTVVRQPARTCLGVLGVAAVGALLFDMLLLSRGLVVSFRDLLGKSGFDVRVLAADAPPFAGPRIQSSTAVEKSIAALPEVETVVQVIVRDAEIVTDAPDDRGRADAGQDVAPNGRGGRRRRHVDFIGADQQGRSLWTIVEGHDLTRETAAHSPPLVVNGNLSRRFNLHPGSTLMLRGRCDSSGDALPAVTFTVAGVADFPFDDAAAATVAGRLSDTNRLCPDAAGDRADVLLVRSRPEAGADAARHAIHTRLPGLHVVTNEDLVQRFSRVEFSYFRQISAVLATVTLFFGFLLIAVLLTVSVNQRLGEIAALRALGLSRSRVVAGVLCESALMVGAGGLLALPLGLTLSVWLDGILRSLPEVPADLHFFVFEPRALVLHVVLLSAAAVAAAAYPMRIVAALPIASTLRREVVS